MPQLKIANAHWCDHASLSAGNKYTLLNIYSGDIILSEIPATIMLSAYIEIISPFSGDLVIRLDYVLNGKSIAFITANASGLIKGEVGVLILPPMPIPIPSDGDLRLTASVEGFSKTTILKKKIIVGSTT